MTASSATKRVSLPLRQRPIDIFFIAIFSVFIITCIISDSVEGLGLDQVANSTNILVPLLLLIRMRSPLPFLRKF